MAGLIIKNDTTFRPYGGSEGTLKIIELQGLSGPVSFEVLSIKTDSGATNVKSECSLFFVNGNLIAKNASNNHGLSYYNDGSKISIYASSDKLSYAYVTVFIKSGMEYVNSISAQSSTTLPSGVINI